LSANTSNNPRKEGAMGNFSEYPGELKDGREAAARDLTPPPTRPRAQPAADRKRAPQTPRPTDADKPK